MERTNYMQYINSYNNKKKYIKNFIKKITENKDTIIFIFIGSIVK